MDILNEIQGIISLRKKEGTENSYTAYLFREGIDKILKKIGEEASEVIIASKNDNKEEIVSEISDLIYHIQVLIEEKNITLEDIEKELKKRLNK